MGSESMSGIAGTSHEVTATGAHRKRLVVVLVITCAVLIAEVIGGLIAGSLALLADAGHVLTDSTGLVLALIAASLATRAATEKRTFGLQRAEVLAALGNALLLVGVAVWVLIMAVDRLRSPVEIDSGLMLVVAVVGALANLAGLLVLRPAQAKSLNMRGAYLEVLGDLIGSLAVIVAAVLILITGWTPFDAIASLAIVVLIIPRAWSLLREVVDVLLEATPRGRRSCRGARSHQAGTRGGRRPRPACLDDHQRRTGAVRARHRGPRVHQRGPLGRGAGPARRMPRRALRCLPLHLSARAGWPPGA